MNEETPLTENEKTALTAAWFAIHAIGKLSVEIRELKASFDRIREWRATLPDSGKMSSPDLQRLRMECERINAHLQVLLEPEPEPEPKPVVGLELPPYLEDLDS